MRRAILLLFVLATPAQTVAGGGPECGRLSEAGRVTLVAGRAFASTVAGPVEVAGGSAYCLSCHDGTVGRPIAETPETNTASAAHVGSHPVQVLYPSGRSGFRAQADLDARLVLEDGVVTCRTCHGSDGADALAIPNRGSTLCLSCHVK